MRVIIDRTPISTALPFDLANQKTHIRMEGPDSDLEITNMGRAAAAELEQFAQIALLTQTIRVTVLSPWPEAGRRLPIGPVATGHRPTVTVNGVAYTSFEFVDGNRPYILWDGLYHRLLPQRVVIEYQAGFGASAEDIPADLAHAIMDQTALYFDGRSPMDARSLTTSPHMARIGAKYRGVQA